MGNVSEFVNTLPVPVAEGLLGLITVLKAIGIAFIVYLVYTILNGVISWRGSRRIKKIETKVDSIDKKLNLLLKKKK